MATKRHYERSFSEGSSAANDYYSIGQWKKCLLINNLKINRNKAQPFLRLLPTFGFDVEQHSKLSAQQIKDVITSIRRDYTPLPNGIFFLVILVEKGDPTVVCGDDDNAVLVQDIMDWINNASMPSFYEIPRILIYYREEEFNPVRYRYNHRIPAVSDLFAVYINDAKLDALTDCEAVCEALTRFSPEKEFSDIFKTIGCETITTRFKKLRLVPTYPLSV